jgi:hypothetical protein
VPENIPEGYVAFRFVSAFTYVSSPGNETITNVELKLPWPYVNDSPRTGKPVGLPENLLYKAPFFISMGGPEHIENTDIRPSVYYLMDLFELDENLLEITRENGRVWYKYPFVENLIWGVKIYFDNYGMPTRGLPYTEVGFDANLKLYHGDQLEWQDGRTIQLSGGRTAPPTIEAYFEPWEHNTVFAKITVKLSDLRPGETVSIDGVFFVAEENANKVRLDDYIESEMYRTYRPAENAPELSAYWSEGTITIDALSQLEKLVNGNYILVVKYRETWANKVGGIPYSGPIDDEITV